jgi:tricorn protease
VRTLVALALLLAVGLAPAPAPAAAQVDGGVDARLLQYPDVSADRVAFVYAGDIWVAPREGGTAVRLSSPAGEETFPRFSPDGSRIAFSGNYDGNVDVYVVPTTGGEPIRVTHHPMGDRLVDWTPDGQALLFASSRASGRQRYNQFWRVSPEGGLPERLPMEQAEFGDLADDGTTLAFMLKQRDTRTWKRYRGGWAPDIHRFDLETLESEKLTDHPANDGSPMWHGDVLYFLSDRGPAQRFNIWAREASGETRQVTTFTEYDITFPAKGPDAIVFQAGGRLHLLDLASETTAEVEIDVVTDRATLKPRTEDVSGLLAGGGISATGQRAVFEARGDVFTVPAEHGPVRNLTASSGVADRYPTWSPDGAQVAWWSDASGEYELVVAPADGSGEPRTVTSLGEGFRYAPVWSPDAERVAFLDHLGRIHVAGIESGDVTEVAASPRFLAHGQLASFPLSWSPDGRWLAWAFPEGPTRSAVRLWDRESGEVHTVTSGYYQDRAPVFDPGGDYLYLLTDRHLQPAYSALQPTWIYPNATQVAAIPLRDDVASPLAPRNDEEPVEGDGEEAEEGGEAAEDDEEGPAPVEIDLEDFERRLVVLPVEPGNYAALATAPGKVVYRRLARTGAAPGTDTPLAYWDVEAREEERVLDDADGFDLSADGGKVLVAAGGRFGIVELAPGQSVSTPLRTAELSAPVDPRAEWRQIFVDVWRMERDFFYDPGMHGVDWDAVREQYAPLVEDAATRWDVNFVLGEMIAELDASHTYRSGGDLEAAPSRDVGLLGVDWALEDGAYRIERIVRGAPWDHEVRSPLDQPGVEVDEGDVVLAVNGRSLADVGGPYAAFQGLAGETVVLTVASDAQGTDRREVVVETLPSEARLRHLEWIESNRQRVDELSGGRVGYVYVRSTGIDGQTELVRQFAAQHEKEALLIDERFNSGGQIPDRFVELLDRPALSYWATRFGEPWTYPVVSNQGPMVMLINGWSGSGGDAFPAFFREADRGLLVGTRTWGGLIGISGAPPLVDGGSATVPTFRMYEPDGEWFAEGVGVEPDIEVPEDPSALARGQDPQIERGVEELLRMLEEDPATAPPTPEPEDRSRAGGA